MSGRKSASGCATALMYVAFAGILAVIVLFSVLLHGNPQPDVAKAARSNTARAADRTVTAQVDRQLGGLRAALPWATDLGTTVADACSTAEIPHMSIAAPTKWTAVTCTRTATAYLAFDGDFRQQLTQLDTALTTAGWKPGDYPGNPPGLVANFDHTHRPDGVDVRYTPPIHSDFVVPPGEGAYPSGPSAEVGVVQAPYVPSVDDGTEAHNEMLKFPSVKTTYFVDWQQPHTHFQLSEMAYPAHDAVLAISVRAPYNTGK